MKIQGPNGQSNSVSAAAGAAAVVKTDEPVAPASARPVSTDQIQLSNLARLAAASGQAPNHIAKLFSLSATVSSGRYQVEAAVLSSSIIEASILSSGNYA
jgi:hypothetical protein